MSKSIIDEMALPEFRKRHLDPSTVYKKIPADGAILSVGAPPGVGKTMLAQKMVPYALAHEHDLVIYVAPTRALIEELLASDATLGLNCVVFHPRPRARCGTFDGEWRELESSGCAALAKDRLCQQCPNYVSNIDPCTWPDQMDSVDVSIDLVVLTEAYLTLNPSILQRLIKKTDAKTPLILLDEGSLLTCDTTRHIEIEHLRMFDAALAASSANASEWQKGIAILLDGRDDLTNWPVFSPFDLLDQVLSIQNAGRNLYGAKFKYIAHDLSLMRMGWFNQGQFSFVPLIETKHADVILFSPYMPADVVEERLARTVVEALPSVTYRHSQTRVSNIADTIGSLRSMRSPEHFRRVIGLFSALLLRDKLLGQRSVVVAKKALLPQIKTHLTELSTTLGRPLNPVAVNAGFNPKDVEVALINYGIVGVNSLSEYDNIYCLGGYYAREDHVLSIYQQALPPALRHDLKLDTKNGIRQIASGKADFITRAHARNAQATLIMLERRLVLQAIGRIRPFTSPANVVLFQMDDLSGELGDITKYATLSQTRIAWSVPSRAELARAVLGDTMRQDRSNGLSYRALAKKHQCSVSTAHKALASLPLEELLRGITQ
jgi:hypothetical protein